MPAPLPPTSPHTRTNTSTNTNTAARALLAPLRPYAGQRVVVGVSGGADSVALLRSLVQVGAYPHAVHVNHQLRAEADTDQSWVEALCSGLDVPYTTKRVPVAAIAQKRGWTLEEAARRVRYQALTQAAKERGIHQILLAHTQNDQAETVLWQVLRGELPLGIPARRGAVERPWLGVTRAQLVTALAEWGQNWREDESNANTTFTRNFLRHEAFPLLETRFGGVQGTLSRLAQWTGQDDEALQALSKLTKHIPKERVPLALLRRWVRRELGKAHIQPHAQHLQDLSSALATGHTRHISLPQGQQVTVTGGELILPNQRPHLPYPDFEYPAHWVLRHRQNGDTMRLEGGTRKLSDILGDQKVPRAWRDEVWLLAHEQQVHEQQVQWLGTQPERWAVGAQAQTTAQRPPTDEDYMGMALELARSAAQQGEVAIGALVVRGAHMPQAEVVAQAANRSRECGDMTRHAELDAVRAACKQVGPYLTDCTLYVTLEPCPMCLGAILEARVGRVVYGASNHKAGALGGVSDLLSHHWGHAPEVRAGVRAGEAAHVLRQGFQEVRASAHAQQRKATALTPNP